MVEKTPKQLAAEALSHSSRRGSGLSATSINATEVPLTYEATMRRAAARSQWGPTRGNLLPLARPRTPEDVVTAVAPFVEQAQKDKAPMRFFQVMSWVVASVPKSVRQAALAMVAQKYFDTSAQNPNAPTNRLLRSLAATLNEKFSFLSGEQPVTASDVDRLLQDIPPDASTEDLEAFLEFYKTHGYKWRPDMNENMNDFAKVEWQAPYDKNDQRADLEDQLLKIGGRGAAAASTYVAAKAAGELLTGVPEISQLPSVLKWLVAYPLTLISSVLGLHPGKLWPALITWKKVTISGITVAQVTIDHSLFIVVITLVGILYLLILAIVMYKVSKFLVSRVAKAEARKAQRREYVVLPPSAYASPGQPL